MQNNEKNVKKRKALNGGLITAVVLFALTAFTFLYIAAMMLFFIDDSITTLANAIALPILAVAMLVITVLIIMHKKSTFRVVNFTTILAIVLSFGVATCNMVERINVEYRVDNEAYVECTNSWKMTKKHSEDSLSLDYKYVYEKDGKTLEDFSDVAELCEVEAQKGLSVNEIIAVIVQDIIFAIIPSFAAILVWLYFKQSEEAHEILNQ